MIKWVRPVLVLTTDRNSELSDQKSRDLVNVASRELPRTIDSDEYRRTVCYVFAFNLPTIISIQTSQGMVPTVIIIVVNASASFEETTMVNLEMSRRNSQLPRGSLRHPPTVSVSQAIIFASASAVSNQEQDSLRDTASESLPGQNKSDSHV